MNEKKANQTTSCLKYTAHLTHRRTFRFDIMAALKVEPGSVQSSGVTQAVLRFKEKPKQSI